MLGCIKAPCCNEQHTYQPYSKPTEELNYLKYFDAATDMPGRDATVAIQTPEG